MPIYEYYCDYCDTITEVEQSIKEDIKPFTICRKCGCSAHKTVSKSTFKLVGSGWPSQAIRRGID